MAESSRNALLLKEKLEVLEYAKKHPNSSRELADKFGCGQTLIIGILKNKENIMRLVEANAPLS